MIAKSSVLEPKKQGAFTLLEVLLVMTIMMLLMVIVAGATRTFRENMNLAQAGQLLVDEIDAARQIASSRNWTVYVYLYKVSAQSPAGYSALQLWRSPATGDQSTVPVMVPVDQAHFLPASVVISEDATHNSPLLGVLSAQGSKPPSLSNLPPTLLDASYVAVAIQPSGMLALDGDSTAASALAACCLTVVPARLSTQSVTPANFVTVQINPMTGNPTYYRP